MENKDSTFMPKEDLEKHIIEFIRSQNICVLATCMHGVPRATAIEFYSKGTDIYLMLEKGRTLSNIKSNPNVSVSIFSPYKGIFSLKGLQISGKAKILSRDNPDYDDVINSYVKEKQETEQKLKEMLPSWETMEIIKIKAIKIDLLDYSLQTQGFFIKQTWVY
jgi:uncharacterized protein YhbP (UPF0306 family)